MTGIARNIRLTTAALLAVALTAAPANAQVQVQGGDALDANQQVGSGGYNQAGEAVDYRARNLLVTGQVGGGRAFQGQINYSAEGAFRGSLGSDSLFNFQRDSIYSAPGAGGYGVGSLGDRVIVTRPTTNIPGYRVGGGNALSTRASYDPASNALTFRQSGGGLVSITGVRDLNRVSTSGSTLGLVQTPGGIVSVDASPLTGVRYNPLDANTGLSNYNLRLNDTRPRNVQPELDDEDEPINPSRIDGLYKNPDQQQTDPNLPEDPLAIKLGTQVQSQLALQLAGRTDNNIPEAQAQAIRGQVFGQAEQTDPNQPPQAPVSPYKKLIADILAQAEGAQAQDEPESDEPAEDARPRWQQILEEPEQAVLDAKRKSRDAALRLSLGLVDEQGNIDYEAELPSIDPESKLGKLLSELDYDLPRMRTLVGKDENRVNNLLAKGEQELKAERYIVAESIYRQVLRETSGDPLAKAGMIHSQMGAGMIRSAAFNLRGLFADHPELIALRYDAKLMPETERLRWLQGRLQTMITEGRNGADPGLVLAYLGYQLEAPPLIEYGLAVAETAAPRDPLMPVLKKIWIDGEDAEAEQDKVDDAGK